MNTPVIIGSVIVFLSVAVYLGGFQHLRWAEQARNRHFETICKKWLDRLNQAVDTSITNSLGGTAFYRTAGKLKVKTVAGHSWTISYPLEKKYLNVGLKVNAEMIIHVYSLIPARDGSITTVFADLTEPTKKWWDSQYRTTIFPLAASKLQEKEQGFILPSCQEGDEFVPREVFP